MQAQHRALEEEEGVNPDTEETPEVVIDRRLRAIHGSIIAMLETLDGQASVNMMIQSDRIVNDFEEEIRHD